MKNTFSNNPAGKFQVENENTTHPTSLKSTIKTSEHYWQQWRSFGVFIVKVEHNEHTNPLKTNASIT